MQHKASIAFSHTADHRFIDAALKARWRTFIELEAEFRSFTPRTLSGFADDRARELERLKQLNPTATEQALLEMIDGQIRSLADPSIQVYLRFSERVMAEYVTVAFLSHALTEAIINAVLAVGLSANSSAELFALLERADIKEKWLYGPKAFHPPYDLPKSRALYGTLQHLTRQRNAFVHYKIELEMHGKKVLRGSQLDRSPLSAHIAWIRRFFSLPYDLGEFARHSLPQAPRLFLGGREPIQRYEPHVVA